MLLFPFVFENTTNGTVVAVLGTTLGDDILYRLADDAGGRFDIGETSGLLTVEDGSKLDYETARQHEIRIEILNADGEPIVDPDSDYRVTVYVGNVNEAPVIDVNVGGSLDEGSTFALSTAALSASDVDADDTDNQLLYTVTAAPLHGILVRAGAPAVAITEFTQADLAAGLIRYVHDGSETLADAFTFDLTDDKGLGVRDQTFSLTVAPVNDAPVLEANALVIEEGGTVDIGAPQLRASDADNDPSQLTFTVGGVTNGRFEFKADAGVAITSFTQADLDAGLVRFVHDGGEAAPAYFVRVDDGAVTVGPDAADVTFSNVNDAPTLDVNALTIGEGQTVLAGLNGINLAASDVDNAAATLMFTVSEVTGGRFVLLADLTTAITQFTQAQLDNRLVAFIHDGGEAAPSYSVSVSDNDVTVGPEAALISFSNVNDAPEIVVNALTIEEGETVAIGAAALAASDPDNTAAELVYTVSGVTGGRFQFADAAGVAITTFTQADVDAGRVQFVHDGGEAAPSYSVSVFDGTAIVGPEAAQITFANVNDAPSNLALANTRVNENAPIGTLIGAAFAFDPDAGDSLTYSLDVDADGRFAINPVSGRISVADGARLDFEDPTAFGAYEITVKATDSAGLTTTAQFTIGLDDLNEAPTRISLDAALIGAAPADGTVVGTLSADDPDTTARNATPEQFAYALLDTAQGRFMLNGNQLLIADGGRIDAGESYEIVVRVRDKGGLSHDEVLTISAADAPPAANLVPFDPGKDAFVGTPFDIVGGAITAVADTASPVVDVAVTFLGEDAYFRNVLGYHIDGSAEAGIVFADVDAGTLSPGARQTLQVSAGAVDRLTFFLIADGARLNEDLLADPAALDLVVEEVDGLWQARDLNTGGVLDGRGNGLYWEHAADNADGFDHAVRQEDANGFTMTWEDWVSGGDGDSNDAVFRVQIGDEAPFA